MANRIRKLERGKLRTYSARARPSKVSVSQEASPHVAGAGFGDFLASLPDVLGAADLRAVVTAWERAWAKDKTILFGFGAHLVKVGLAPIVVDLMERGAINALMMNGAGCVHDIELAMYGRTSEDVGASLEDGSFGMARDTADALNEAIAAGARDRLGMGSAIGRAIDAGGHAHAERSVLCAAHRLGVPVTVHAAIGTDIHHMHASADGAALGATSFRDFETLAGVVAGLQGGVVFNVGSAVILPEVFLKALSIARNLGRRVDRFTSVNLDFVRQYRPETNVVDRPTRSGRSRDLAHRAARDPGPAARCGCHRGARERTRFEGRQSPRGHNQGQGKERRDQRQTAALAGQEGLMGRIVIVEGDITEQAVDAIVNAANSALQLGAGVAGAIRERGGPEIQAACDAHGPIEVGEAAVTTAGSLPARWVIHAAGMAPGGRADEASVRAAVRASLALAAARELRSIAFPAIGAGIGGFSMQRCAEVSIEEARNHFAAPTPLEEVRFVLFGEPAYRVFEAVNDAAKVAAQMARLQRR